MEYKFSETEQKHAERLGGKQHRTRQLRRAILYILTGHKYSELAWYLVDMGLGELCKMAAVCLDQKVLVPHGQPSDMEFLLAALGHAFYNIDPQAPQRKRQEMLAQGLYQGSIPYPYTGADGYIHVTPDVKEIVERVFSTLSTSSYGDVANELNAMGFKTSTGRAWNKDSARTFCQNPIHAGYAVSYTDRRSDGSANKRGGMIFTRLTKGMPDPPITFMSFMDCNPVMNEREIIVVVPG
jgi:hypothetical protein